jgi:hypothetical protein
MGRAKQDAKLTPAIQKAICNYIVAGGFPHVAAEAAGVTKETFNLWCEMGRKRRAAPRFKQFWQAVCKAQAEARLSAEIELKSSDPKTWLRSGPGKEMQGIPGWTTAVKPIVQIDNRSINVLADPNIAALITLVMAALSEEPAAKRKVIDALNKRQPPQLPAPSAP